MNKAMLVGILRFVSLASVSTVFVGPVCAQGPAGRDAGQMSLRKTVEEREYKGQSVEGENRLILPGDSLWRILIQEKGLSEKNFEQYVVVILGINPQLKNANVLKVGANIFVPMRPDEVLGFQIAAPKAAIPGSVAVGKGTTTEYRVKHGDRLYRILREQLGIIHERELAIYYALVKDLNPNQKNWDYLQVGEVIRLPTAPDNKAVVAVESTQNLPPKSEKTAPPALAVAPSRATPLMLTPLPFDHARALLARENLPLVEQVAKAIGGEFQKYGEEVVALKSGTVRIDKSSYPVVYHPKLQQRVIIDAGEQIPTSLRKKLEDADGAPVLAFSKRASLQEAVAQLLSRLGYQTLPNDRPIIFQEGEIAYEVTGTWMALAPEESNKTQELFVITLTDQAGEIPEYLRAQLSAKGLHLKEIVMSSSSPRAPIAVNKSKGLTPNVKTWPRDKKEIVDAFLFAYGIPFGVAETQAVELREGLRVDAKIDRVFDSKGKRIALFFHRLEPEIKKSLQESQGMKVMELDLSSFSPKEIIGRLLNELGDETAYREHKFPAGTGNKARLNISTWGFLLRNRSMFLTDRRIPIALHRFFFEKGLEIVYFQ
ncbi:MAG: hypothetical protein WD688_18550 [Candidatus Binatia bacterium]